MRASFMSSEGARGNLIKILWHDGLGMSLYAKRLEKGRFIWPSPADGVIGISTSQLAYMLDGIDWRNPVRTFRPERAG
jgi:transposase